MPRAALLALGALAIGVSAGCDPEDVSDEFRVTETVDARIPRDFGGARLDTVIVRDEASPDDGLGASGVDICAVSADCATALRASVVLGGGRLCVEPGPGCVAGRTDPQAAIDPGERCWARSDPSDYISLGTDGQLAVTFDGDLRGCSVRIVEFAGASLEAYRIFVCDGPDLSAAICLNDGRAIGEAPGGGDVTFLVPSE